VKDLILQLENLLPEHDCVVVPGLGGFVQNEVTARIQPGARLFYPASKDIGFNPRLKFNDGLLAQAYQEAGNSSFEEANAAIQADVQEIQDKLAEGKFIRLGRAGTLFSIDKQLIFRPDHHNHFYPEAYGLTPFTFPLLHHPVADEAKVETPIAESIPAAESEQLSKHKPRGKNPSNRDEYIHIRFNRTRIRQLIAASAVFLFLLFFSKPAGIPSGNQEAGMLHTYLRTTVQQTPKPVTDSSTVKKAEQPLVHSSVPTPSVQKTSSAEPIVATGQTGYYIIVSAFLKRTTAKRWMAEHEGESILQQAGIVVGDGHARVYVQRFETEDQANEYLGSFTSSHPEYASAWVYSSKND
jgi:hypothetical protein